MIWNHDISAAPRGNTFKTSRVVKDKIHDISEFVPDVLWLATKCGKVVRSYMIPESGKAPARWSGLATGEVPVAWQDYVVPVHPNFRANAGEEAISNTAAASIDPVSRADDVRERQHASTVELTDDCRQGGNEQAAAASVPELITHKHMFLDDVGGSV